MIKLQIYIILGFVVIGCNNQNKEKHLKTRIERVNELPFRTITLSEQTKNELFEIGKLVWGKFKSDSSRAGLNLIASKNFGGDFKYHYSNEETELLRQTSYDLWKIDDLLWSSVVYKSSSINSQTNNETFFYVIEIEYCKVTGILYIFIPIESKNFTTSNYTYRDRN